MYESLKKPTSQQSQTQQKQIPQKNSSFQPPIQRQSVSNLTGIPTQMKRQFEDRSGLSFDDVRVHYNSDKPAKLGALAYTQGNRVHIASGQEKHLMHELGHVVQQKQGRVKPSEKVGGMAVNDNKILEREADGIAVQTLGKTCNAVEKNHTDEVIQMCPEFDAAASTMHFGRANDDATLKKTCGKSLVVLNAFTKWYIHHVRNALKEIIPDTSRPIRHGEETFSRVDDLYTFIIAELIRESEKLLGEKISYLNCDEFSRLVFSHLVQSQSSCGSKKRWAFLCSIQDPKNTDNAHVFVVTSNQEVICNKYRPTQKIYDDNLVVDAWAGNTVMKYADFIKKEGADIQNIEVMERSIITGADPLADMVTKKDGNKTIKYFVHEIAIAKKNELISQLEVERDMFNSEIEEKREIFLFSYALPAYEPTVTDATTAKIENIAKIPALMQTKLTKQLNGLPTTSDLKQGQKS